MKTSRTKSTFHTLMLVSLLMSLISGALLTVPTQASPSDLSPSASGDMLLAKRIGGTGYDSGNSIAVDSIGNIYTTGYFDGTVDFDPGAGISNLVAVGLEDIFIAKLDINGSLVWAKNMGGSDYDGGNNIALDSNGNIYTTGYFVGTVDFDPGAGTANLTSVGESDIFISKLDNNGNFVWAKSIGGVNNEGVHEFVLDSNGYIYAVGSFVGTTDFNPDAGVFNLTSAGSNDIFVFKLDNLGSFVWAKRMGGVDGDQGVGIALDTNGNVYTTGVFRATADFDPGAGTFNLVGAGNNDIYISKLDSLGIFVWAKGMGEPNNDGGAGIALDTNGNVYTTGSYVGTVDFDPGAGTANLTSAGNTDIFVSKLDSGGNFIWAKSMGGTAGDSSARIVRDSSDNFYLTGNFAGTADFDPNASTVNLTSAGLTDIFVTKLNSNGNFAWAKNMGGTQDEYSEDIALDSSSQVFTTGTFVGVADFDPGAGVFNLTSAGVTDIFISGLKNDAFLYLPFVTK
jgi:hypothetical protein